MHVPTRPSSSWLLPAVLAFTAWLYWPGLAGPVLLDDAANLERVQALAGKEGFAIDVLTENPSGPLGRPLSMASFMLDLYLLDAGVWGAKLTNLLIHLATGVLVWVFSLQVFTVLGAERRRELALWVASLWLLAPLLVSTTLYMVQRMAQLATLFSLLSCIAYLRWRRDSAAPGPLGWLVLALVSIPLAVLSKENGLLAVPLLILIELTLLQPRDRAAGAQHFSQRLRQVHIGLLVAGMVFTFGYLLFSGALLGTYANRDFTLWERLLTQMRILWLYIGQLLWVDNQSLGLYHDGFAFSTDWRTPLTTAWSLLAWLVAVPASLWLLRVPLLRGVGFGLLFYLASHALESTVFPLELYFEHRNYLPAVGIFLALACALAVLVAQVPAALPWGRTLLALILLHATLATAFETQLWANGRVFHLVAVERFPNSVRANEGLALEMALLGEPDVALDYVARAEALQPAGGFRHRLTEAMVYCRAGGTIPREQFMLWQMSDADFRDNLVNENSYSLVRQIQAGRCDGTDLEALADHWGELVLRADPQKVTPKLFLSMAILENHLQRYESALYYVEALLQRAPGDLRAHMMRLYFAAQLGRDAAFEDSRAQLEAARDEGRLNAQERYNLQLLSGSKAE